MIPKIYNVKLFKNINTIRENLINIITQNTLIENTAKFRIIKSAFHNKQITQKQNPILKAIKLATNPETSDNLSVENSPSAKW